MRKKPSFRKTAARVGIVRWRDFSDRLSFVTFLLAKQRKVKRGGTEATILAKQTFPDTRLLREKLAKTHPTKQKQIGHDRASPKTTTQ